MKLFIVVIFILLLSSASSFSSAQLIYVSPNGNDNNPGTIDKPLFSFKAAQIQVRSLLDTEKDITVIFRDGYYYFDETVILGHKDFSENGTVTYKAFENEQPVFTSGQHITGWKRVRAGDPNYEFIPDSIRNFVYVADVPKELDMIRFLLDKDIDWLEMAKINVNDFVITEKFVHGNSVEGQMWDPPEEKKICNFSKSMEGLSNADNALMFSIYTADFELQLLPVEKIDGNTLITAAPGGHRLALPEEGQSHGSRDLAFIHNLVEGIDSPGKWAHYPESGKIYLWPAGNTYVMYIPKLFELIRVEGVPEGTDAWFATDQTTPVKNLVFDGITFSNCKQGVWEDGDVSLQHDWGLIDKENALLRFRGADNCVIKNCSFIKSGGAGIAFDLYAQNNLVENCTFDNLGFEAIRYAGYGIGTKDENKSNQFINNEVSNVCEINHYGAAIIIWNSGFNRIADNYIHDFASRAVLLSAPRSRAFTKNNQEHFPSDRYMREQAWPMARWFEIPDEALVTVKMTEHGTRHEQVDGNKEGKPMDIKGDEICAAYRYSRGNIIERNLIMNGAQELFADGIYYVTSCATGEINKIRENYICNTAVDLPLPNIPFRLLYVDGFSGDFEFKRNFAFNSRVRFEAVAPYSWWGEVDNSANIFYNVRAEEEEYFGGRNSSRGNICIGIGPNDPREEYVNDYKNMIDILQGDSFNQVSNLPGKDKIIEELQKIINTYNN